MTNLIKKMSILSLATLLILLAEDNANKVLAGEVNLDTLCRDFPQNSRCKDDKAPTETENNQQESPQQNDRENQSTLEDSSTKVIKLNVSATGGGEEWVRIEKNGDRVKVLHTAPSLSGVSELLNLAAPLPIFNFHKWNDHRTTRVVFKIDNCSSNLSSNIDRVSQTAIASNSPSSSCEIVGEDAIELPEGIDITQGRFTMDYSDGEASVERSISFKVPAEEVKKASSL